MDNNMNQMPGSVPVPPTDGGIGSMGMTPPPLPPMGGEVSQEDPHEKILASLARIEGKLDAIAAKVGA